MRIRKYAAGLLSYLAHGRSLWVYCEAWWNRTWYREGLIRLAESHAKLSPRETRPNLSIRKHMASIRRAYARTLPMGGVYGYIARPGGTGQGTCGARSTPDGPKWRRRRNRRSTLTTFGDTGGTPTLTRAVPAAQGGSTRPREGTPCQGIASEVYARYERVPCVEFVWLLLVADAAKSMLLQATGLHAKVFIALCC